MNERIRCAFCNKPLRPQIVNTVELPDGESYRGGLTVVSRRTGSRPGLVRLGLWDGKSYGRPHQRGDSPFCAATCAAQFAEAAHRSGFRLPPRKTATSEQRIERPAPHGEGSFNGGTVGGLEPIARSP